MSIQPRIEGRSPTDYRIDRRGAMRKRGWVLVGSVSLLLVVVATVLAAGPAAGGSGLKPPPPAFAPSAPPDIPRPRSTGDGLTIEERNEIIARRGTPEWGPHTAGTVIEIAGRQVQLPEGVHVNSVIFSSLCAPGESCVDTPAWVLQKGDLLLSIGEQSGRLAPGTEIPDEFGFLREALR